MNTMQSRQIDRPSLPGILPGDGDRRRGRQPGDAPHRLRFVTQSHALGTKGASPRSLFMAATIAVALYLIGRRLSA